VLILEDDDEAAALTVEMINQLGYDTIPGSMNGVELALEIQRRRLNLPVLLASGYAEAARRSAGARCPS